MNKTLIINAHPKVDDTSSVSIKVFNHFLESYKEFIPNNETIEQINLYDDVVPMIDKTVLSAWEKQGNGQQLTDEEQKVTERMSEILQQFKSANTYVIVLPLHNFNIPSKLKDYMDNIMIARETFKYTETGSVGLLKDGRRMLVIQASGGIYTNDDWYTDVEYSHKYLKAMFNFLGIEDYQIVRAQGTAVLDPNEVLQNAYREVEEAASRLANK
ncbi:NAD(P)H-dependent oxidoreductase [Bacillus cereus]|uniref:FMN-dependent NADH:quinone oxidoreductase 1 n=1 Tax=Bacillus cereus (strain ZK / E33L) TaxID=288681 RepID=AZOR1_BACCZ|nr:NAD(P)H-dependent oxidoreductase [Bacillus cereus]Q63F37.1 RecName: Full=FMN-dependent NADH:quinone oxidoreductase 1; AltName: Full=Azo-dye reductase 1; AltName: Full=FMN-dependent NADH-azo compound oxidoreductase 1; AltName: Full=FMN-dependent NADH-azoreductase 1 [Bacillus cereus E33L]AAU19372.1 acyl carrier protein phosphodiesterase 3; NAD(P)H dehydrogenase (quinone) [Bacillus cereus E33L]AJI30493.1 NADPH-dependent FMN reductase family protein [Bacillus cereus E33L]QQA20081.1 NAD(P)H-depen